MADKKFTHVDIALSPRMLEQVKLETTIRAQLGDITSTCRTDMMVLEILRAIQRNNTQRIYLFDPEEE